MINQDRLNGKAVASLAWINLAIFVLLVSTGHDRGYDVSIYPRSRLYLVFLGAGLVFATASYRQSYEKFALGLTSIIIYIIGLLPIFGSRYYVGRGDALTHLGWARDIILTGHTPPIIYPATHILAASIRNVTGLEITTSVQILPAIFTVIFAVGVMLVGEQIYPGHRMLYFLCGCTILPIRMPMTKYQPVTMAIALLLIPFIAYLAIQRVIYSESRHTLLFYIGSATIIIYHPIPALNFFIILGIGLFIYQRKSLVDGALIPYITSIAIYTIWILNTRAFELRLTLLFGLRVQNFTGKVGTTTSSLSALGGSVSEIFMKLYATNLLLAALGLVAVIVATLYKYKEVYIGFKNWVLGITVATIPIGLLMLSYLIRGQTNGYLRHAAFLMVVVTIFGGVGLAWISRKETNMDLKPVAYAIVIGLVLLAIPVLYGSPYVLQDSGEVTNQEIEGYDHTFQYVEEDSKYVRVRSTTWRFKDGIYGTEATEKTDEVKTADHFGNRSLGHQYQPCVYLPIPEGDYVRETQLYNEFRYSSEDFNRIQQDQTVGKLYNSPGYDLYQAC